VWRFSGSRGREWRLGWRINRGGRRGKGAKRNVSNLGNVHDSSYNGPYSCWARLHYFLGIPKRTCFFSTSSEKESYFFFLELNHLKFDHIYEKTLLFDTIPYKYYSIRYKS
jgi:hypothetical protein